MRANLNRILAEWEAELRPEYQYAPREFRPTDTVPVVRMIEGRRELAGLRWWLTPHWAKELSSKYPTFNARSETVSSLASFREPFKRRRCLVVADAWHEWKVVGGTKSKPLKQRHTISMPDGGPFAMAGLWDRCELDGKVIESCTIITTSASPRLASIHERMPVVLPRAVQNVWLDPAFEDTTYLQSLLQPYEGDVQAAPDDGEDDHTPAPAVGELF